MMIFLSDKGFFKVYGMKIKAQLPQVLMLFTKGVGVTNAFLLDSSGSKRRLLFLPSVTRLVKNFVSLRSVPSMQTVLSCKLDYLMKLYVRI